MTSEPMPTLDDVARMQSVDRRNMLRLINELPEQCETALGIARSFAVEPPEVKPNGVFITGIGDSGLAADMAAAVLADSAEVPVVSDHGGKLPTYVDGNSIVIVVDYPGTSESELRNLQEAKNRGARIICITSGRKLLETASSEEIDTIRIPPGQSQRSAIGYLFVPLIVAIEKLGLTSGQSEKLSHAIKLMKNAREALRFENPTSRNVAKQTAESLFNKLVVIYSVKGYRVSVANRWKRQIDANSKALAFIGAFDDLAIGDIRGWESVSHRSNEFGIVLLSDADDRGETAQLATTTEELLSEFGVAKIELRGSTVMEKLLYGVYLGDYVSYYLALLYGVDPMAVNAIPTQSKTGESAESMTE